MVCLTADEERRTLEGCHTRGLRCGPSASARAISGWFERLPPSTSAGLDHTTRWPRLSTTSTPTFWRLATEPTSSKSSARNLDSVVGGTFGSCPSQEFSVFSL